jgi:hypothetical protein
MKPTNLVRFLIALVILNGVYTETGMWTALAFAFVAITLEMHNKMFMTLDPPAKEEDEGCEDDVCEDCGEEL